VADERETPVAGVIVQLLDTRDNVIARALSNERGEYRLTGPSDVSYRVHAQRIGFRPVFYGPFLLRAGDNLTQRLVLTGVPVTLSTVSVVGQNPCRSLGDSTATTYLVWEQVRAALTAILLTASGRGSIATTVVYERTLDPTSGHIREQSANIRADYVRQPWRSLTSDSLRQVGYIVTDRDGSLTYHAPGLDVLVSDAFLEDHCFRIASSSDGDRVGIEFEPTPARRRVAEIQGTMWLDRHSSELRGMGFRYANIPRERGARSGGDMEFVRMSNGAWVISRWDIRMPLLEQRSRGAGAGTFGGVRVPEIRVAEIKVTGGDLVLVRQGRDTLWSRPPLAVLGGVADSVSGLPVPGARVTIVGTSLSAITDTAGRFTVTDLLPGVYTIEVRTPSLDSVGAVHQSKQEVTDGATSLRVRTPTARQIVATLCSTSEQAMRTFAGELGGIVAGLANVSGDSVPPRNAKIVAEWTDPISDETVLTKGAKRSQWLEARTDARGMFRICGVPVNTSVFVHAELENRSSLSVPIQIPANRVFTHVLLTLDSAADRGAVFTGIVLSDSTRRPIVNAEVALPDLSRSVLTNDKGGFRLGDIPPGDHRVVVRRIGYGALDTRIAFAANRTVEHPVMLSPLTSLESVIVTAERTALPDFEENRRIGLGHFLTRAELAKQEGRRLSDILTQVPGVHMVSGTGNRAWLTTNRGIRSLKNIPILDGADIGKGADQRRCYAQVYIDRMLMYAGKNDEPLFDINTIPPDQIEAIEYYAGPAQTPLKYSVLNSACGVLVIHTRRGP
jgi:hypothetical protein